MTEENDRTVFWLHEYELSNFHYMNDEGTSTVLNFKNDLGFKSKSKFLYDMILYIIGCFKNTHFNPDYSYDHLIENAIYGIDDHVFSEINPEDHSFLYAFRDWAEFTDEDSIAYLFQMWKGKQYTCQQVLDCLIEEKVDVTGFFELIFHDQSEYLFNRLRSLSVVVDVSYSLFDLEILDNLAAVGVLYKGDIRLIEWQNNFIKKGKYVGKY